MSNLIIQRGYTAKENQYAQLEVADVIKESKAGQSLATCFNVVTHTFDETGKKTIVTIAHRVTLRNAIKAYVFVCQIATS